MDIHKPKPWHSVREFLKEYVIIVVGVLTALGAEQAAEALHWRHLAEQHERELHASAQFVALNAVHRLAVDVCLRGELKRVGETLRQPGEAWRGLNPGASGMAADWLPPRLISPGRAWAYTAWDSALGDGSLTHLPRETVSGYALLFSTSKDIMAVQRAASEELPELAPLAFDQSLNPQDKAHYLATVAKADRMLSQMDNMARTILTQAAQEGFWPSDGQIGPQLDAARRQMGDCIRDVPKADFVEGGRHAAPMMKRWLKGEG